MVMLKKMLRILKIKYLLFRLKQRIADLDKKEGIISHLEALALNSKFKVQFTADRLLRIVNMSSAVQLNRVKVNSTKRKLQQELQELKYAKR